MGCCGCLLLQFQQITVMSSSLELEFKPQMILIVIISKYLKVLLKVAKIALKNKKKIMVEFLNIADETGMQVKDRKTTYVLISEK
jgi:hydroxypyruvate isomerase